MKNKSHLILVLLSIIITFISFIYPSLYVFWLNNYFLFNWLYLEYLIQLLLYSFIHGSVFHLLWNTIITYYFWSLFIDKIGEFKFILLFIFTTIFIGIVYPYFSDITSIWISWFWVSLITFYWLFLYKINDLEYKWAFAFVFLSLAYWLYPWISFLWHFLWFLSGIIFYLFLELIKAIKNS